MVNEVGSSVGGDGSGKIDYNEEGDDENEENEEDSAESSSEESPRVKPQAEEESPGLLGFFFMHPILYFVFIVAIALLHFAPLWPRATYFIQGGLTALFISAFWLMWKFMLLFNPSHHEITPEQDEEKEKGVSSTTPAPVLIDDIQPLETYMNILDYDMGPYDPANFRMENTRTCLVSLLQTNFTIKLLSENLPYRKYFDEKVSDTITFVSKPLILNLKNTSLLCVPHDLTKKQRVSKSYPIAMKFVSEEPGGQPRTIYLFSRTDREKEFWFHKLYERIHYARGNIQAVNNVSGGYKSYISKVAVEQLQSHHQNNADTAGLNIALSRIWFNLYKSKSFNNICRFKLSHILRRTKVARYFKHVGVRDLIFGDMLPCITKAHAPFEDEEGLWCDFDVVYSGTSEITIRTQGIQPDINEIRDSSAYQELAETHDSAGSPRETEKKQVLKALAENNILNSVLGNTWIQQNITEKPITLTIKLLQVKGTVTLNLGQPPADRFWFGFRGMPHLDIVIEPSYGNVTLTEGTSSERDTSSIIEKGPLYPLMSYLEYVIKDNFAKSFVYPNLHDRVIPFFKPPEWSIRRKLFA